MEIITICQNYNVSIFCSDNPPVSNEHLIRFFVDRISTFLELISCTNEANSQLGASLIGAIDTAFN